MNRTGVMVGRLYMEEGTFKRRVRGYYRNIETGDIGIMFEDAEDAGKSYMMICSLEWWHGNAKNGSPRFTLIPEAPK